MNNHLWQWNRTDATFLRDERGQGLTEYALVTILVAIITVVIMILMAPQINDFINQLWLFFTS